MGGAKGWAGVPYRYGWRAVVSGAGKGGGGGCTWAGKVGILAYGAGLVSHCGLEHPKHRHVLCMRESVSYNAAVGSLLPAGGGFVVAGTGAEGPLRTCARWNSTRVVAGTARRVWSRRRRKTENATLWPRYTRASTWVSM